MRKSILFTLVMALMPIVFSCQKEQTPQQDTKITVTPDDSSSVYGLVSCNGIGIGGVSISDGIKVVRTNSHGIYQMRSKKENRFVFISIPSGYEIPTKGVVPQIKRDLFKSATSAERVDFQLSDAGDQTNHTMLIFGDIHLAGSRSKCREQFKTFTSEIAEYISNHKGEKIYAVTLGDMTWDYFWYTNSYSFDEYLGDMEPLRGLSVFHTIGNHDHNMRTSVDGNVSGWNTVDWDTGKAFRFAIAPSNYSFNIGEIHYIVLDDIFCKNTTGGTADDRHYEETLSEEGISWLKNDLHFISKNTPVVITMHAPLFDKKGNNSLKDADQLIELFKDFSSVTFITGHSHKMWNIQKGNIKEYNSGAICAAWWDSGYYFPDLNIGQDGSPGGYRIMNIVGESMTSLFKSTGRDSNYQFRAYDRNSICLTAKKYNITNTTASNFNSDMKKYGGFDQPSSENKVILNIWDVDNNWKVEVTEREGKNEKVLSVNRIWSYDPLFLITYIAKRYENGKSIGHKPAITNHFFEISASSPTSTLEIKITDDEGRTYTETMKRPKPFTTSQYIGDSNPHSYVELF